MITYTNPILARGIESLAKMLSAKAVLKQVASSPIALGASREDGEKASALAKTMLDCGPKSETGDTMGRHRFAKGVALPPQNSNGTWTDVDPARAGGNRNWRDQNSGGGTNLDPTTAAIVAIHKSGPQPMFGTRKADDQIDDDELDELTATAKLNKAGR